MMGALIAVWLRGMPNDIYFQIGLVGADRPGGENAILIVEFAAQIREGKACHRSRHRVAARLRSTADHHDLAAFVLGVFPLVKATGAGAPLPASRWALASSAACLPPLHRHALRAAVLRWLERKQIDPTPSTTRRNTHDVLNHVFG